MAGASCHSGSCQGKDESERTKRSEMPIDSVPTHEQTAVAADLRDPALAKIRDLIYRLSGIFHSDNKFYLLARHCQRRMKELGSRSFSDYLEHFTMRSNREAEMRSLPNEITIGERPENGSRLGRTTSR
jgi:CheR methyltransferase-like protein